MKKNQWQRQTGTKYSGESSHTAETKILHFHSANSELNEYPPNLMESL